MHLKTYCYMLQSISGLNKPLLCLSRILLFLIFIALLFIFVHLNTGHDCSQNNKIHISWESARPATVFFSYETTKNTARKVGIKVSKELLCQVFLRKEILYVCVTQAFISCVWATFTGQWFAHAGLERQTNNCTNIHTYKG